MILKKALSLGSLALMMGLSSTSFAANMSCTVEFTYATKNGLMPLSKKRDLLTTTIETGAEKDAYCPSMKAYGLILSLCAAEDSEAKGVMHAVVKVEGSSGYEFMEEGDMNMGMVSLALPKKSGAPLIFLDNQVAISPVFTRLLQNAKMDLPVYENGDSASMDAAVVEAVKKGVIEEGLITSVKFSQCLLK